MITFMTLKKSWMTRSLQNNLIESWHVIMAIIVLIASLIIILSIDSGNGIRLSIRGAGSGLLVYCLIGFIAQIIDGSLGMAYGVSSSSFLLLMGISPRMATAAVHTAEVFTTGASGISHLALNNIDKKLFLKLLLPGIVGSVAGAYLISNVFDGNILKPYIAAYLLILGIMIFIKGILNKGSVIKEPRHVKALALLGGFFDATGGGGWGPIVTSNIIVQGNNPSKTIGTVNTAEFFVTFVSAGIFLLFVGIENWDIVIGLILGGVIAAPFGALISVKMKKKMLTALVGVLIIISSAISIANFLF